MTWILDAHERRTRRETVADGLRAAVRSYYEDYTDADQLSGSFMAALEELGAYTDNVDIDELVANVEREIHDLYGRDFASLAQVET